MEPKFKKSKSLEPELDKWKDLLWRIVSGRPVAYCLEHRRQLEIVYVGSGNPLPQTTILAGNQRHLLCPVDDQTFQIDGGSFWTMCRRYESVLESKQLKNATYRDLDNVYTPVLKVEPKPKDDRYSVQVEIDDTPIGKKLVIYAADRREPDKYAQIFLDPVSDKLTFDSNDLHPNMIFSKIVAYFKDSKMAKMERHE